MAAQVLFGDCLDVMRSMSDDSVDLVLTSPPYEAARTYGIEFNLRGQDWVDWAVARYLECVRVSRGLVAWVVEGQTKRFQYSAAPFLLAADLHRAGVKLRKPPAYHRHGISGSGGPDWLRNDYEFIICSSKGRLPWSDNTAMGHPPKYDRGGRNTNRTKSGGRVAGKRYAKPAIANPGNVIRCKVGGGLMGSKLAHDNEAPFPESLAEFMIRSFCPPGGRALDCFAGSGTVAAVAELWGRDSINIEIRQSQVELIGRRMVETAERKFKQ